MLSQAYLFFDLREPGLQQSQVVLQPQLLVLDDAYQLYKLVVFLLLLADVLLAESRLWYILKSISSNFSVSSSLMKFILSLRMVASVPSSISILTCPMVASLSESVCFIILACFWMCDVVPKSGWEYL